MFGNPIHDFEEQLERLRAAYESLDATERRTECDHPVEIGYLVDPLGRRMYCGWCPTCQDKRSFEGRHPEAWIPRRLLPADYALTAVPIEPGRTLTRQRWAHKRAGLRAVVQSIRGAAWFYPLYIASPAWQLVRLAVLKRAKNWCERCRAMPAEEIHHLTYRRLGLEALEDLLAVCRPCHEAIEAEKGGDWLPDDLEESA